MTAVSKLSDGFFRDLKHVRKGSCSTSPLKGGFENEDEEGVFVLVSLYEQVRSDFLTEQTTDATLALVSFCL